MVHSSDCRTQERPLLILLMQFSETNHVWAKNYVFLVVSECEWLVSLQL